MALRQHTARRSIEALSLAAVVALILALASITLLVYARMAAELSWRTRESIANRVMTLESRMAMVYSLAADEAMNLMSLMGSGEYRGAAIVEQLGRIRQGLVGCSSAWIVPEGGRPIVAQGCAASVALERSWWRPYLQSGAGWGIGGSGRFASLGIHHNIGYIAPAFRGSTGIGTILPLVVVRYSGIDRVATAFFEIDMTVILDTMVNSDAVQGGNGAYPVEISFYDSEGKLLESTRNLPLVRVRPFEPAGPNPEVLEANGPFLDYLFPGQRIIEAKYRDDSMGLLCVGRTPAGLVMRDVRLVATYVLVVGALALGSVFVLGLLFLRTQRRVRSFEEAQLVARFDALQAKVNPHFLFNTLDSMIGVAEKRDFRTLMRMLKALSSMLHMTVRRTSEFVSLAEELEYVRSYLAIQEVRYRGAFAAHIEADEDAVAASICRFGIQPIVENCFTHGVHEGCEDMHIRVEARLRGRDVWIEVEDDGPDCDPEVRRLLADSFSRRENLLGREGGLFNLDHRLRLSFGEAYGLELPERKHGFCVRVRIPAARTDGGVRKETT